MLNRLSRALIATLAASAAQAQIKAEHPRFCVMNVGPTQMMFSAFQENRTDAIFCQHVPELGKTRPAHQSHVPGSQNSDFHCWKSSP